ncbi:DUF928 domain-containing protein [[Leptolyngbya] sp. PCC 7376]|uniref:DUF928 domain-containing protein n=1 Tax=[Leptolyngbya] sp. PCC 7376 TaxID=111781 RepID=UPI0002E3119F|nr:DUF928 domain-containing protein [[Leptolyngbya] sp. PCC 7376]
MNTFLRNNYLVSLMKPLSPLNFSVGLTALFVALAAPVQAACLPNTNDFEFVPSGTTQQVSDEYPRIFWRLQNHQAENLQISVTDETDRELYFWDYKLSQSASESDNQDIDLMSVQPSPKVAAFPMNVGSIQNWQLTLICDYGDRSQDIVIRQQIERVATNELLENSIKSLSAPEKIEVYLVQGLINQALTEFMNLRHSQPSELVESTSTVNNSWLDFQRKAGIIESQ